MRTTATEQLELLFDRPAAPDPEPALFWCVTHQEELPASEQSEDPRYCRQCFEVIRGGEAQSYPPIRWSSCGLVQFLDGRGYAVDRKGRTADVGREVDIAEAFKTGEIAKDLCPDRVKVLKETLKFRKEQERARNRTDIDVKSTRAKRSISTGGQRVRPAHNAKHKSVNTRHLKARKGFSRRAS